LTATRSGLGLFLFLFTGSRSLKALQHVLKRSGIKHVEIEQCERADRDHHRLQPNLAYNFHEFRDDILLNRNEEHFNLGTIAVIENLIFHQRIVERERYLLARLIGHYPVQPVFGSSRELNAPDENALARNTEYCLFRRDLILAYQLTNGA